MAYLISFLEGVVSFLSPCLLPMLPVYIAYFGADEKGGQSAGALKKALGFVAGFTAVFVLLGVFAAGLGGIFSRHRTAVDIVTGGAVVLFGLNFLGVLRIGFLNAARTGRASVSIKGFWSAVLFGVVFSVGWTPCVGAFLGSALMLASQQGSVAKGVAMLLAYSLGLGIPFVISAVLLEQLRGALDFLRSRQRQISLVSGWLLVALGVLMMTGQMGRLLSLMSF
jgi:cytochrome c-type biogenesis protein